MSDYAVDPLSIEKIEEFAKGVLSDPDCPKLANGAIDVLKALRLPRVRTRHGVKTLRLKLVPDQLLPDKLAQVWARGDRVTVTARTSLWNRAEEHDSSALKELRHEYGHVYLHSGARTNSAVTLDRQVGGNTVHNFIDPERRVENQADWLAACLALPRAKVSPEMDVRDLSADWNVPIDEAKWRLEQVRLCAPKRLSESLRQKIDTILRHGDVPTFAQNLWDQLPDAPTMPPEKFRLADSFLVEFSQYNCFVQTGWTVERDKIVPLMLKMQV